MPDASYSLRDLIAAASSAERLALSERAVRQYIAEGLLPPPRGQGMTATYSGEHLAQLRLVLRLAHQYVPPLEIRRWMQTLTGVQLHALLERPPVPRLPAEGDAHAYLSRLLKTLPPPPGRAAAPALARAGTARATRRAPAAPLPDVASTERTVWLRVSVHADVELLVRAHGAGVPAQTIDRLIAAMRAVLADGAPGAE